MFFNVKDKLHKNGLELCCCGCMGVDIGIIGAGKSPAVLGCVNPLLYVLACNWLIGIRTGACCSNGFVDGAVAKGLLAEKQNKNISYLTY